MRHIKPFRIVENSSIPKKISLYVYEYSNEDGERMVGYYAPNDDFMTSIFKTQYPDGWGDYNDFTIRGGDANYYLQEIFDFYSREEIQKVPSLEGGEVFDLLDPGISLDDTGLAPADLKEDIWDETWKFLNFDPESAADGYNMLTNDMREKLIMALIKRQKYDPRGLFTRSK
jgi:hypothetical protein